MFYPKVLNCRSRFSLSVDIAVSKLAAGFATKPMMMTDFIPAIHLEDQANIWGQVGKFIFLNVGGLQTLSDFCQKSDR